ncbi:MAG: hypothetical protein JXR34_09180 [Bacteroidales bacterium]|nr:hypothetical protein [Bacteroidales bacterium]
MKNLVLTTVLAVLLLSVSQDMYAKEKLGFRAGYQHSSIYKITDPSSGRVQNPLTGFYFGAYHLHTIGLREIFTLNAGLEYMATGFRIDDDSYRKLHYASIPLFARVKLGLVFAQAGFNLNFKVKEDYKLAGADAISRACLKAIN